MPKRNAVSLIAVSVLALSGLAACSDDDDEPTASPSPSAPELNILDLTCPEPIGSLQVKVDENDGDEWSPGYGVDTNVVLDPVAFGQIVFTDNATGQTNTQSPITKPGADTTGALECTFVDEVTEEGDPGVSGTVTGTVFVVQRVS